MADHDGNTQNTRKRKYETHADKLRAYRERDREAHNRKRREWRAANLEKARAIARQCYAKNKYKTKRTKEQEREKTRLRRIRFPEAVRASARRSWRKNIERNRARRKANTHRRRNAPGKFTADDVLTLFRCQRGKCASCELKLSSEYHVDHITPISKGGTHNSKNLQLLCRSCNLSKGAKLPEEFMRTRGLLL